MPAPRPTRIEHVVDGARLRAQLTAAAHDGPTPAAARVRAMEVLKGALFRGRMIAKERLEEGGAGGVETARLLARVTDEVVGALYDFTTIHVHRARNPTEGERLAVVAVGGYGRGTLAPFSDLDLLFLRRWKTNAHVESVVEFMLYALWDLGFKVGHASRTVEECLRLAREDMTIRTTLLEGRRLCGDAALSEELGRRFRREVVEGTAAEFVAAKLAERDERHARAGASRYLVEPNVKEGKGGLRDLHTLYWIAQYLHPPSEPGAVRLDAFTGTELKAFLRASDVLWAVRHHLHWAMGRADERLSFDVQPEVARRMGFGDRVRSDSETGGEPAVERFMRRYFLTAREVGGLTRVYCAKLEAEHAKPRSTGLSRFFPRAGVPKRTALGGGLHEVDGRLDVDGPEVFARDPAALMRLFAEADRRDLDLHPDAFAAVTRSLGLIGPRFRRAPEVAAAFLEVLARGRETCRTLTLMNESGLLGRYLPEWGRIVGQMQFNMYHSYTVDEHTLHAVGVIADIARGRHTGEHPLCAEVWPRVADPEALLLAMLLHDTGKGGEGGQEKAGGVNARTAAARLGLASERVELVGWLVENHLAMSDYAQKRDISDPSTVAAFARLVAGPERLRMLLVLTVADIRAVGPGVWNGWKGQLLRELYGATEAVFRGDRGADPARHVREVQAARAAEAREALAGAADANARAEVAAWAAGLEDAYFTAFSVAEHADHLALSRRAAVEGGAAACVAPMASGFAAEASIVARDRPGLFADLAAALAAAGAGVVGARIHTSAAGEALDVFLLQDMQGRPFGAEAPAVLKRLAAGLEAAARGGGREAPSGRLGSARADAFTVAPTIAVDNAASETATVVEVSGRDRPGLLEALGRALCQAELQVGSAHVETHGERAVDAFYVTDAGGAKLTDPTRLLALEAALTDALAPPELVRPRRLPRARANAGR